MTTRGRAPGGKSEVRGRAPAGPVPEPGRGFGRRLAVLVVASLTTGAGPLAGAAGHEPRSDDTTAAGVFVHGAATPQATLRTVTVVPDSLSIGDRFEVRVVIWLPEGSVAFVPDSLLAPGAEPLGPPRWAVTDTGGEERTLSLVYPMIALDVGVLVLQDFELAVGRAQESVDGGLTSDDDMVASWSLFRDDPARLPSARLLTVPEQRIGVASLLVLDDVTTRLAPRPPADVSGGRRDWTSTLLFSFFGVVLLGVVGATARDVLAARRAPEPALPPDPRVAALAALDALHEAAPHRDGRVRELYAGFSDIVRRYLETLVDEWGPPWTTTEILSDLQGSRRGVAARHGLSADRISGELRGAERVKFGGLRPPPDTAEASWRAIRSWIAESRP